MNVGVAQVSLRLPENLSLKGKRQVLKSIISRVRNKFDVAVAEGDDNDDWQLMTIGISAVSNDRRFTNSVLSKVVAFIEKARFEAEGEPYKVELVDTAEGDISLYTQGGFTDLCRGPHLQSSKPIKAIKLTGLAGAYWRGDSSKPQLTRIYGTAFYSKEDLDAHLERLEEARRRDHRRRARRLAGGHRARMPLPAERRSVVRLRRGARRRRRPHDPQRLALAPEAARNSERRRIECRQPQPRCTRWRSTSACLPT